MVETDEISQLNDLFHEESVQQNGKKTKPWWKSQFFVVEPVLFGTWDGVFTSCLINIFGVVLFLRTGWMVGNVGIWLSILIVVITVLVALLASLSAIGVCERFKDIGTGGVYCLVSKVLGGKVGGTIGVMYAFGLSVVSALYCTGFAESVTQTFNWESEWAVRGVAIGTLILLLAINLAGVKWVIRLQLVLLLVLVISTSDFIIGTVVHIDPEAGFVGYSSDVMFNNSYISLQPGETFFTVFGVFFPTATGVMAGVNMSGDLKNPAKSIPNGTLFAIAISFVLYLIFVLLLGSTCSRQALQVDFMIAEKVAGVGALWLLGVYMSSTSSCSTGLYGAPRVLQSIANENVIPALKFLGRGFGPNKTPVIAICMVGLISLLFIFVGNLNGISPIITCNFMLVYATVDYAYFALAMSYDIRIKKHSKYKTTNKEDETHLKLMSYGSMQDTPGTMVDFAEDLHKINKYLASTYDASNHEEEILKERFTPKSSQDYLKKTYQLNDESENCEVKDNFTENEDNKEGEEINVDEKKIKEVQTMLSENQEESFIKDNNNIISDTEEILAQPKSWYSFMCNRWASLFGMVISLTVMFLIHWIYAFANILAFLLIYLYTSLFNPGLNPGASTDFSLLEWAKELSYKLCRKHDSPPEQFVVTSVVSAPYTVVSTVLTYDNKDFANRERFHQSTMSDYIKLVSENKSVIGGLEKKQ